MQTDPRGLRAGGFTNTVRPLRPLWIRGAGLRKVNDAGLDVFVVDLVFGGVQNYYEIDRVVVPRAVGQPDSILKSVSDPVIIGPSLQWQTFARLRPFTTCVCGFQFTLEQHHASTCYCSSTSIFNFPGLLKARALAFVTLVKTVRSTNLEHWVNFPESASGGIAPAMSGGIPRSCGVPAVVEWVANHCKSDFFRQIA